MDRAYSIGICTGKFNPESMGRLLQYLQVPCEPFIVRNVENEAIRMIDTLFIVNPIFDSSQAKAFIDYIENGGTALFMIAAEEKAYKECLPLLSTFGVKIERLEQSKQLPIEYLEYYPKAYKRGTKNTILSKHSPIYPLFSYPAKGSNKTSFPFIAVKTFWLDLLFAVKVVYGQGAIVAMSSSSLPEDRAEILEHLLLSNKSAKSAQSAHRETTKIELKSRLPAIIEETFQVYEEVPLEVIRRKLGMEEMYIDPVDLLLLLEELIREGKLLAKIRGNALAKY